MYSMKKSGFHTTKSDFVDAPLIDELPAAFECEFIKVNEDGNIIGKIVNFSADERILGDDGNIDLSEFYPISFDPVHNAYHKLGDKVGNTFRDENALK